MPPRDNNNNDDNNDVSPDNELGQPCGCQNDLVKESVTLMENEPLGKKLGPRRLQIFWPKVI